MHSTLSSTFNAVEKKRPLTWQGTLVPLAATGLHPLPFTHTHPPHHTTPPGAAGDRLRADMISKFAGRFSVERRILVVDCVIE